MWQAKGPSDPSRKRYHSWRHSPGYVCVSNDRDIWKYSYEYQLVRSRNIGEWNLCGRQQGFGRMCADFWPVLRSKRRGRWSTGGSLSARYPESSWAQLNLRQKPYLSAGRDGAESTARFEAMVEGLQECEARIFIDRALLNKKLRAELGNDLAKRARALLDERVRWLRAITWTRDSGNEFYSVALSSWERLSEELYDMASEIAAKIEKQAER